MRVRATCSEGCTLTARILAGGRLVGGSRPVTTDLAGSTSLRLAFTNGARKSLAKRKTLVLTVVVTARDVFGNAVTARQTLPARRYLRPPMRRGCSGEGTR